MLLRPGERAIATEVVDADDDGEDLPGVLYLTNLRLVFEGTVGGNLLSPGTPRTLLDVDLEQVSNVVMTDPAIGRPRLNVETERGANAFTFKTRSAAAWVHSITSARSARLSAPRAPAAGATAPSPSAPAVYLHCTHCGTLNPAGRTRCASCGAAL
ncbi:MAG TPA: zinc finger Ran-binding domain-containing protein [Thermoplasmata archaeon]|nr:zinc finger Ran-binding domain-containing protein [Thermoplasmata archaeon]